MRGVRSRRDHEPDRQGVFEYGVDPVRVIKLSGIGCSSKTPAYFLNRSHGFNAVHGRMPAVGTGALLANRTCLRSV